MNQINELPEPEVQKLYDEAVLRVEGGESAKAVVASYPAAYQNELSGMLAFVQAAGQIRRAPVPAPSAGWRASSKRNFLAAAATYRDELQSSPVVESAPVAPVVSRHSDYFGDLKAAVQSIFTVRTLRLAPAVLLVALILFSTFSLVSVAQAAVPGDFTYSFKQWIRRQELALAPADLRDNVRLAQERELAEDVAKAAANADNNAAVIRADDEQIFYGRSGRLLKIGSLHVMDRYQPDANKEEFENMEIDGALEPGVRVALNYQILPGQKDTVQGVSLRVVSDGPVADVEQGPAVDSGQAVPVPTTCQIVAPENWVEYEVQAGDNLSRLAEHGATSIDEIMLANCLDRTTILIGELLFVPEGAQQAELGDGLCAATVPDGWVEHTVGLGDNLTVLADRTGTTIDEIMAVNCMDDTTIVLDSILMVPEEVPE